MCWCVSHNNPYSISNKSFKRYSLISFSVILRITCSSVISSLNMYLWRIFIASQSSCGGDVLYSEIFSWIIISNLSLILLLYDDIFIGRISLQFMLKYIFPDSFMLSSSLPFISTKQLLHLLKVNCFSLYLFLGLFLRFL